MRQSRRTATNAMTASPVEICTNNAAARAGPFGKTSSNVPSAQATMTNAATPQCRAWEISPYPSWVLRHRMDGHLSISCRTRREEPPLIQIKGGPLRLRSIPCGC